MKIRNQFTFKSFSLICILIISHYFVSSKWIVNLMGAISITMLIFILYKVRRNSALLISMFLVSYSIYSIWVGVYLFPEIGPVYYQQILDYDTYRMGMECIYVFVLTLYFLIKDKKLINLREEEINSTRPKNLIICMVCVMAIVITAFTDFSFGENGERAMSTPLYEYKIIFYLIGIYYSKNSKTMQMIWMLLMLFTGIISLLGGNRADVIPLVIAYIYCYHNTIKPVRLIISIILAAFGMIGIGIFRTMLFESFNLNTIIEKILNEKMTFDTAIWAYVPALESIELSSIVSFSTKLLLLGGQFIYIVGGGLYSDYRLEYYSGQFYQHSMGFVSPIYFYFWFGLFGSILFGMIVYMYVDFLYKNNYSNKRVDKYIFILGAYFVSTVSRWFLYSPYAIIRGTLLLLMVLACMDFFDRIINYTQKKSKILL